MRSSALRVLSGVLMLVAPLLAQGKRLWVLRSSGEMVEYDPVTFAAKQTVKIPAQAAQNPANLSVNRLGQILFASAASLPFSEEDAGASHKVWIWNGHSATTIDQGVRRELTERCLAGARAPLDQQHRGNRVRGAGDRLVQRLGLLGGPGHRGVEAGPAGLPVRDGYV